MKRAFIVLFFLMSLFFKAHSEDIKRPNIYNVQRAIEALNKAVIYDSTPSPVVITFSYKKTLPSRL